MSFISVSVKNTVILSVMTECSRDIYWLLEERATVLGVSVLNMDSTDPIETSKDVTAARRTAVCLSYSFFEGGGVPCISFSNYTYVCMYGVYIKSIYVTVRVTVDLSVCQEL